MAKIETGSSGRSGARPDNREVENENLKTGHGGEPRPATEPAGAKSSSRTSKTRTDPGSGKAR